MKNAFYAFLAGLIFLACTPTKQEEQKETTPGAEAKPQPAEFADPKYMEIGKQGIAAMASGDIDKWMQGFADNAIYNWSGGDSLVGKKAISDYWTERRTKVIDQLNFTKDIWLAIKINQSQRGPDVPGVWLMSWYQVNATYKNGASVTFWTHVDMHFDANDKIDRAVQYLDRAPINAALAMKKK